MMNICVDCRGHSTCMLDGQPAMLPMSEEHQSTAGAPWQEKHARDAMR